MSETETCDFFESSGGLTLDEVKTICRNYQLVWHEGDEKVLTHWPFDRMIHQGLDIWYAQPPKEKALTFMPGTTMTMLDDLMRASDAAQNAFFGALQAIRHVMTISLTFQLRCAGRLPSDWEAVVPSMDPALESHQTDEQLIWLNAHHVEIKEMLLVNDVFDVWKILSGQAPQPHLSSQFFSPTHLSDELSDTPVGQDLAAEMTTALDHHGSLGYLTPNARRVLRGCVIDLESWRLPALLPRYVEVSRWRDRMQVIADAEVRLLQAKNIFTIKMTCPETLKDDFEPVLPNETITLNHLQQLISQILPSALSQEFESAMAQVVTQVRAARLPDIQLSRLFKTWGRQ